MQPQTQQSKTLAELYKDLMNDQEVMRAQFLQVLLQKPRSLASIASEIKISVVTLRGWYKAGKNVEFLTLMKIKFWVEKYQEDV